MDRDNEDIKMTKAMGMKKIILFVLAAAIAIFGCGCMISSGIFVGINRSYGDNYIEASYKSFDGSLARSVSLKEGDAVQFWYKAQPTDDAKPGEDSASTALEPAVVKGGETLLVISDGAVFIVPEDGSYDFAVRGKDKNGSFALWWETE